MKKNPQNSAKSIDLLQIKLYNSFYFSITVIEKLLYKQNKQQKFSKYINLVGITLYNTDCLSITVIKKLLYKRIKIG